MSKYNVRRKAQLGLDIREGGIAIPIANNMWYIHGRKHEYGGVTMGPNNKNGVEVEGGEVVQMIDSNHPSIGRQFAAGGQSQTMRVFSSVPLLRGVSPAELVMGGANPNTVFKAQEEFKDRNRINDDGTTYEMGGEGKSKSKSSRSVTGVLPYGYTIRNLYAVENPYKKGVKGNIAKMYDSRTLGAGVDVVSGHPELYKKAKSGKMTKKQADETAVIHLRKDDNAIRSNYADIYGKAASDTLSYGPRFLVAQARYQQGNVRKAWPAIHKAMAKGNAKALKKAVLQVTPKDHEYRRKWIEGFKVYKAGGIYIKPSKRGTFIAAAIKHGMGVQEFASRVLANKEDYSPAMVKKANFARNASRWKKEFGGSMIYTINGNVKNGLSLRPKAQYGKQTIIRNNKEWEYDEKSGAFVPVKDVTKYKIIAGKTYKKEPNSKNYVEVTDSIEKIKVNQPKKQIVKQNKNSINKLTPINDNKYTSVTKPNTGESYRINPLTGEWIRNGVTETSEPSVKGTTKVSSKSSSTARGEETKASKSTPTLKSAPTAKATIQDTVNKITMDAWKASKSPKIDLSKAKMPTYNVSDLGSKETKESKAKLNNKPSKNKGKNVPWIGQYKTFRPEDWLGIGTNLAGHIAGYFANNSLLKKYPMPVKPVLFQAAKLKTTHNINPKLASIGETEQMNLAEVGRNTSSSSTSIARKQRIMNEARDARNKLYGEKENIETQLINLDRRNRQDVYNRNIAAYNDWLDKTYVAKTNKMLDKQRNLISLINGIPSAVNYMLGNIENRSSTNNTIRAIAVANPDVDGRLLGIGDYYVGEKTKKKYDKFGNLIG